MKRDKTSWILLAYGSLVVVIPLGLVADILSGIWIWSLGINIPLVLLILLSYWRTALKLGL